METKRAKVIMLPTNDETELYNNLDDKLSYSPIKGKKPDNQHLYFITDDRYIHGGDDTWCYNEGEVLLNCVGAKKIVATTDESLGLPQPSQSFIKEYCKAGGIDEVLIEMEQDERYVDSDCPIAIGGGWSYKIKVNPDNTVNILPIKDSWSREEVVKLLEKFDHFRYKKGQISQEVFDKWIEENL